MLDKNRLGWPAWIWAPDYEPAGEAELSVETHDSIELGWVVRHPFGPDDAIMVIRATRGNGNDGGVITLSLTDSIEVDTNNVAVRNVQHSRTFHEDDSA